MSQPENTKEADDYQRMRFESSETAKDLLLDAIEWLSVLSDYHDKLTPAEAILIAAHALIAQRDIQNEERRAFEIDLFNTVIDRLSDISDGLDYIASSQPDSAS